MSTGSGFPVPDKGFDPVEHARNAVLRVNQTQDHILHEWQAAYVEFYGLQPRGGSRYTPEQMQQTLASMPFQTCRDIMERSAKFVVFVDSATPGALPDKYKSPAFEMSDDGATITVGELKPAWQPQPETVTDGNAVG